MIRDAADEEEIHVQEVSDEEVAAFMKANGEFEVEDIDIADFSDIILGRIGCPKSARKLWTSTVHGC